MDKLEKALKKLTATERKQIHNILSKLKSGDLRSLDIKKLKNTKDIYRARKGDLRIIYKLGAGKKISILAIERRSKRTYKNL